MRLAFYYGIAGTTFDRWISWLTRGPYSHCELVFSDGLWFSSSPRDGGVRYKAIVPAEGHWEELEVLGDEDIVRSWCNDWVGAKYDWLGGLRCVCPLLPENRSKWFCSEICIVGLQQVGLLSGVVGYRTSPNELYDIMLGGG